MQMIEAEITIFQLFAVPEGMDLEEVSARIERGEFAVGAPYKPAQVEALCVDSDDAIE
jgi:hypothetical protein